MKYAATDAPQSLSTTTLETRTSPVHSVILDDIRVFFRSYEGRPTTLKEALLNLVTKGKFSYFSMFEALNGVSVAIEKGETFGILGSNGAGKSTLLKVIAGVLPPTTGTIKVEGVIDSLIQLGAGFDHDLNAIENIYLAGSLRKQSRATIKERVPQILEFAELEGFAKTPIKYYSSGMYARLGFAVAIDSNPDVLLVDEVLAVGDERFRLKCEGVFENFKRNQKTIIMVSHSIGTLKAMCNRIGVLSKGKFVFVGVPDEAERVYLSQSYETRLTGSGS